MKFYFNEILYKGKPLVWEYNSKANNAECLFITTEKNLEHNRAAILKELSRSAYPGISITGERGVIEDYSKFIQTHHPWNYTPKVPPSVPKLSLSSSMGLRNRIRRGASGQNLLSSARSKNSPSDTNSDSPGKASPEKEKNKENKVKLTRSTSIRHMTSKKEVEPEKKGYSPRFKFGGKTQSFDCMTLENIINGDTEAIRETTIHLGNEFDEKVDVDRNERKEIFMRNEASFTKEKQYPKADEIYPLKKQIILLMKRMIEEEFNPVYQQWKIKQEDVLTSEILKELFHYFCKAIRQVMDNSTYNCEPTEYELLSADKKLEKFVGGEEDELYHFANYRIRQDRALFMMMDWMILVNPSYSLHLGRIKSLSPGAIKMLDSFREFLITDTKRVDKITYYFNELEKLIIESGKIEGKYWQLITQLKQSFRDKATIDSYSSLCGIVATYLHSGNEALNKKYKVDNKECDVYAEKIVCEIIKFIAINHTKYRSIPYIAKFNLAGKDIYLNEDWSALICVSLKKMDWASIVKRIPDSKRSVVNMDKVARKIYDFITVKAESLVNLKLTDEIPITSSETEKEENAATLTGASLSM